MGLYTATRALARKSGHHIHIVLLGLAVAWTTTSLIDTTVDTRASMALLWAVTLSMAVFSIITITHGPPVDCPTCTVIKVAPLSPAPAALARWCLRGTEQGTTVRGVALAAVRVGVIAVPAGCALALSAHLWFAWAGAPVDITAGVYIDMTIGAALALAGFIYHIIRSGQ